MKHLLREKAWWQKGLWWIWQEFIFGGHLLSLGVAGIACSVKILMDLPFSLAIILVSYLIPQIIYSFNHFKEAPIDLSTNLERARHLQKMAKFSSLIVIFYLLVLVFTIIIFLDLRIFVFAGALVLGGILYTLYFKKLTARILCFKNIYASLFGASIVFMPLVYYWSITINSLAVSAFFLFVFLRWLVNTIFFDLKDATGDKEKKLKTVPVVFGERKTMKLLHILNLISVTPIVLGVFLGVLPFFSLILIFFFFYSYYYLLQGNKASRKRIRMIAYIITDGEYVFWPLMLILSKFLMGYV